MIFNSFEYWIFFLITFILYYIVNKKHRYIILLIASYVFYGFSDIKNIFILLFITLVSYFSGKLINNENNSKKKKIILITTIILCIGTLLYFKYSNFLLGTFTSIFNGNIIIDNIVIPLGISFFTLQSITYPIDIYRKDVKEEKNIFKFALFVSFFPQILSGPIGKSKEMLPQFNEEHKFNLSNIKEGLIISIYGLFQKLVLADCIAIAVNTVYNNLQDYTGIPILLAVFLYSFQIYFDFVSYSNIARGCGKMLGYNLTNNFNSPYFADSIKGFWSRWHISLSTWFRDYLYFPLGGNRKGNLRTYFNLLIVFIVSGLWHGAAFTFIIWGLLHGIYQVIERRFKIKSKYKILNIIITFLLVTFAWIFFRSNNINDSFYVIRNMFNINLSNIKQQILSIGIDKYDIIISVISIILVFMLEIINKKTSIIDKITKLPLVVRWGIYLIFIFSIIVFGTYGPGFDNSQFIYLGY